MSERERRLRFERLFNDNFRPLLGYAARRVADPTVAADIVAEVFTVAWRRLDEVPPDGEARLWLYGTARRVLANHHRSERRRSGLVVKIGAHLILHVDRAIPESAETAIDVRRALDRLPADGAELLRLVAWEGLTPTEIAQMWSIPAATVRTRLHRARQRLRDEIEGNAGAEPDMWQTTGKSSNRQSPSETTREEP